MCSSLLVDCLPLRPHTASCTPVILSSGVGHKSCANVTFKGLKVLCSTTFERQCRKKTRARSWPLLPCFWAVITKAQIHDWWLYMLWYALLWLESWSRPQRDSRALGLLDCEDASETARDREKKRENFNTCHYIFSSSPPHYFPGFLGLLFLSFKE